jgi:hypothetical protein
MITPRAGIRYPSGTGVGFGMAGPGVGAFFFGFGVTGFGVLDGLEGLAGLAAGGAAGGWLAGFGSTVSAETHSNTYRVIAVTIGSSLSPLTATFSAALLSECVHSAMVEVESRGLQVRLSPVREKQAMRA